MTTSRLVWPFTQPGASIQASRACADDCASLDQEPELFVAELPLVRNSASNR